MAEAESDSGREAASAVEEELLKRQKSQSRQVAPARNHSGKYDQLEKHELDLSTPLMPSLPISIQLMKNSFEELRTLDHEDVGFKWPLI